ncbi:hypothetical protein [Yoonia sp.]|uniref:hypothetical protein n=1 Tax=Yoonia sp. TaxID=2212373 RepID=UPI003F4AA478
MMPWGAYLRYHAITGQSVGYETAVADREPHTPTIRTRLVSAAPNAALTKKCRTATLPGAPCASYLILRAVTWPDRQGGTTNALLPAQGHWPEDLPASPDTGPPRFV